MLPSHQRNLPQRPTRCSLEREQHRRLTEAWRWYRDARRLRQPRWRHLRIYLPEQVGAALCSRTRSPHWYLVDEHCTMHLHDGILED